LFVAKYWEMILHAANGSCSRNFVVALLVVQGKIIEQKNSVHVIAAVFIVCICDLVADQWLLPGRSTGREGSIFGN